MPACIAKIRKILGFLPQEFGVYPKVSAETMLNHLPVLKGRTSAKQRPDGTFEVVKAGLDDV